MLNQAYMYKLDWEMVVDPDKLLVKVIRVKYNCGSLATPSISVNRISKKLFWIPCDKVRPHVRWVLNDDRCAHFLRDS